MDYNKAIISGRLTRDPELRTLPSGQHVCEFTIATNRAYTDSDGDKQEESEFHNVVAWKKQAETICQFAKKGTMILVDGRLKTRFWDKDGVKHYKTEIIVDSFRLGPKPSKRAEEEASVISSEDAAPAELPF
jgi:single-strand DNA-binding protein